jgi:hypothetical protein
VDRLAIDQLLRSQDGTISRSQALELGATPADLRRLVRRRELARVHHGVFVDHTGPLTWRQRAWAAVLYAAPAALSGASALRAANGPGHRGHDDDGPIHVAVGRERTLVAPTGVVLRRTSNLASRVQWNLAPPRLKIEEAVLDVAAASKNDLEAVATLADAVGSRRTTAARLQAALDARARIGRRELVSAVLSDVATGACSALEHAYLTQVERPHGLPVARRQVRASSRGPVYRDVLYEDFATVVELDGRLDHTRVRDRDRDLDRYLDAALEALLTVRLGWGQTVGRPCVTARKLGRLLQQRGWTGSAYTCPSCGREDGVASESSGDPKATRSA